MMKSSLDNISEKLIIGAIVLAVFLILSPYFPLYYDMPGRDSGVFIYAGEKILDGNLPYVDVWDHKGPLLYYINALGLLIGFGSLYGLWVIQYILILISAMVSFILLKKSFGQTPALFGTFFWVFCLPYIIQGGNLTEEYGLIFQFLALLFFYLSQKKNSLSYIFMVGVCVGFCLMLKPNIIGIAIAVSIYCLLKGIVTNEYYLAIKSIICLIIGLILPFFIFSAYFLLNGAFYEFIDQYFFYNIIYSSSSVFLKLKSIILGFHIIKGSELIISAWILSVLIIASHYYQKSISNLVKNFPLIILAVVLLPLDLILTSGSGRTYAHYYMTLLPVFCLLFTILIWFILKYLHSEYEMKLINHQINYAKILIIVIVLPLVLSSFMVTSIHAKNNIYSVDHETQNLVSFLTHNTKVDDPVLFWGGETTLNVLANRNAPTRYVYQFPFFTSGYSQQHMVDEFINDLRLNPPKYIVDTISMNSGMTPINQSKRTYWYISHPNSQSDINLDGFFAFIEENYNLNEYDSNLEWTVYQLKNNTVVPILNHSSGSGIN